MREAVGERRLKTNPDRRTALVILDIRDKDSLSLTFSPKMED